jgi:GTP pyrophosphokinase
MPSPKDITTLIKNLDKEGAALVQQAFHFAEKAHEGQVRFSGDPYFSHVFETAKILAELGMGPRCVAAGLLHDVLEDAKVAPETIEKEFGKEVLFLVDGVTKLGHLRYHGTDRHIESLRKLFVAMSKDLRVLIIKLADRLHNMQTLAYVRPEKQLRIAKETLEVYAPLAYRLGIRRMSRELEDLAFPFVHPEAFEKVKKMLHDKRAESGGRLEKFNRSVQKALAKAGITNAHTEYRVKGVYSLYRKLERKDWDIEKVYDLLALRIVVPTVQDCYRVLGVVHGTWRPLPGRIKDYIAFPKPNGYHGIHTTIFTGDGSILEIQIRTESMHQDAEFGIASHFAYKESVNASNIASGALEWVRWLLPLFFRSGAPETAIPARNMTDVPGWVKELADVDRTGAPNEDLSRAVKADFFADRVFVFTPKGDVIDLPQSSNPIDFAYAVHSDLGDHTAGAKVNGKLVSIETGLKNGDIVEIITKETAHPSRKWLELVKTSVARKHISRALEKLKL